MAMWDDVDTTVNIKDEEKIKEPSDYMVILLNDDFTPREFVVVILMKIFHKAREEATRIMLNVHHEQRGIVGIYTYDIALTKANQVHQKAKEYGFPLKCIVEEA